MSNYFFKPELENLSQGARLKFVRELRYMSNPNVAEFLELGGEKSTDSIDKNERNAREPQLERLKELADLFDVSNYAIRRYNFVDPNEVIYQHMWEEELCLYSEFIFDKGTMKKTFYNKDFINGLKKVFIPFYDDSVKRNYEKLYIINGNDILEDVLIKNNII